MSMDKLITEVKELEQEELHRASEKFGVTNCSDHESYAVLLEEVEEASEEANGVHQALQNLWDLIKKNAGDAEKLDLCKRLETSAVLAACEFIQVAAMAKKAAITVSDRTVFVDLLHEGDSV